MESMNTTQDPMAPPAPVTTQPAAPAAFPVAPAQAPVAPAAPATTAAPFAVFPDSTSFNARVDREARVRLKELGIEDPDAVKTILAEHQALKAESEKRRQESLSELEREREARTKAETELAAERAKAENAQSQAQMFKLFAEHGVKNYDFAMFAIQRARATSADPAKFDASAFLTAMKADPSNAAALGLVTVATTGVTTTTEDKDTPPKGAAPPTTKSVKDMTPEEFRAHVERTTGFTPR